MVTLKYISVGGWDFSGMVKPGLNKTKLVRILNKQDNCTLHFHIWEREQILGKQTPMRIYLFLKKVLACLGSIPSPGPGCKDNPGAASKGREESSKQPPQVPGQSSVRWEGHREALPVLGMVTSQGVGG